MHHGFWHFEGMAGWSLLLLVVVGAFLWLIVGGRRERDRRDRLREVLDRRLASGEIDRDTYDELRRELDA